MSSTSTNINVACATNNSNSGIICPDLSEGKQANKLPLVNRFDKSVCPEFVYIESSLFEPEIAVHFHGEKGCECVDGHCGDQTNTDERKACYCNGVEAFCMPGICHCSKPYMGGAILPLGLAAFAALTGSKMDMADVHVLMDKQAEQGCPKLFSTALAKSHEFAFQVFMDGPEKGWALRALKPIGAANRLLFEYAGQLKLSTPELEEKLQNDKYSFGFRWCDKSYILDANTKGNLARFCTHSSKPNCQAHLATLDNTGVPHVLIYSERPISEGEELTLDYGIKPWFCPVTTTASQTNLDLAKKEQEQASNSNKTSQANSTKTSKSVE